MKFNLSEVNDLIRSRRSIRPEQFSTRKVQKDQIELILSNAQWAPNHGNTEPWRFHVFLSDDSRAELSQALGEIYLETTPKEAQNDTKLAKLMRRPSISTVVVAVSMSRQKEEKIPEIEEIQAVACAIQNMQLTANAYGIGSFWSSPKLIYSKNMNNYLELESKDKCLGLLYFGYPKDEWPKSHRKPLEYNTVWKTQ
ncbi:MAG: nitroreductase [Crocinitomicaceae bacterium]